MPQSTWCLARFPPGKGYSAATWNWLHPCPREACSQGHRRARPSETALAPQPPRHGGLRCSVRPRCCSSPHPFEQTPATPGNPYQGLLHHATLLAAGFRFPPCPATSGMRWLRPTGLVGGLARGSTRANYLSHCRLRSSSADGYANGHSTGLCPGDAPCSWGGCASPCLLGFVTFKREPNFIRPILQDSLEFPTEAQKNKRHQKAALCFGIENGLSSVILESHGSTSQYTV